MKHKYIYTVATETPNILESGSTFSRIKKTCDEKEAFDLLANNRNYLERKSFVNGKIVTEIYDTSENKWY